MNGTTMYFLLFVIQILT